MNRKHRWWIPLLIIAILAVALTLLAQSGYPADETVLAALQPDKTVIVTQTEYGWFFDGPSESDALIFYPGAMVEETAYAPLLHRLASEGMDVCLVRMPLRMAVLAQNKADGIMELYSYEHWYIGGHSLGGAVAANYAAANEDHLTGLVLLAAYPTHTIGSSVHVISIYGSEDGVLNRERMESGKAYVQGAYSEYVIDGGNHAQFGNYGTQRGDYPARLTSEEQQALAAAYILNGIG